VNDQTFALLVQRYAEGDLSAAERKALTEEVLSRPDRRDQFGRQVRLNLELGALLQVDDAEDARLRASLIVDEDEDARDRRVMEGVEKRLRIGAFKAEAERAERRSSRSIPVIRERATPKRNPAAIWAVAAAVLVAVVGLSAFLMSGNDDPKTTARRDRPVEEPVAPTPAPKPIAPRVDQEREAAEAKQRDRARRLAEERAAMERDAKAEPKPVEPDGSKPAQPRKATTMVAMARLMSTTGTVNILAYGKKTPAQPGQDLLSGQGIETVGPLSWAALRFGDGTRLELWADTHIARLSEPAEGGKHAIVTEGTVLGAVVKQQSGRPFLLTTPHGEAKVLGTVLAITVEPDGVGATRLEVGEGKVQFKEAVNGAAVDVTSGLYTVASAGAEMSLKGIPPLQNSRKRSLPTLTGLEPARFDAAVRRAVGFLKTADSPGMNGSPDSDELILWALIHAGVDPYDAKYQQLLMKILDDRRENATYSVAIRAMILEELNRIAYQGQLLRCAQVLVDNQCRNGQWDYRVVTPIPDEPIEPNPMDPAKGVTGKGSLRYAVKKRREGPPVGDNSNSYYAALGLRACHDAGIVLPEEVISRAAGWWTKAQLPEGGWGYSSPRGGNPAGVYGSMTAGGVGSLMIYDFMRGQDWKKDPAVKSGMNWLGVHFTPSENPGAGAESARMYFHYLNAMERAGLMAGADAFGRHAWYPEAARILLDAQKEDGSWNAGWNTTWDTCFAVLFLRRAGHLLGER
jgi:hypothetical protein